ncbi:MAG: YoaP domain-containing protein [Chlorobi bacterium]|nr:YoaP domain-containing protein [Chlorobiota bacterium]
MPKADIIHTNAETIGDYGLCGYKNPKNESFRRKTEWTRARFADGMRYNILFSEKDGAVGGIEYVPGEKSWRPVNAKGYMMIHCIYIMNKDYKGFGYGQKLLDSCITDAVKNGHSGLVTIARKGTWMASNELFVQNGFVQCDSADPDYELLVKKFDDSEPDPSFKAVLHSPFTEQSKGLVIMTSDQCPYAVKTTPEIELIAKEKYDIEAKVIEIENAEQAQNVPSAFGMFCMMWNGRVISDHPISKRRFTNIMDKIFK